MSRFFQNREGQTPLEEEMRLDLKLKHVQDMTELYELELENIAEGISWCASTKKNHLEYPTWLELHKKMLGKVWKFAGNFQNDVRPKLLLLEKDLKYWLEHKTYPPQEMMAILHEKLLTIHPFKDGNGRWSRVLIELICEREKFKVPNWGLSIKDDDLRRKTYIQAIKEARHEFKYEKLIHFMFGV
jgi:fido (protein-threonine AMPylation protein)